MRSKTQDLTPSIFVKLNIGKNSVSLLFKSPKINNIETHFEDWLEDIEASVEKLLRIEDIYNTLLKDEQVKLL